MIGHMDKPNKPQAAKSDVPTAKYRGPVLNLRLGAEREAAVAAFIAAQKVPPDKSAVVLAALDAFLRDEGFWPPAGEK